MKTIVIGDIIYKVTDKEFLKIIRLENEVKAEATLSVKASLAAEDKLSEHLDEAKKSYKYVGMVYFHWRE